MNKPPPKWKKFEELVYDIQKELSSDSQVTPDDHIYGQDSKTQRQIDISIKRKVGQFSILIVIDCKDYANPVDVKDVETFIGLVRDVRANKGAIVSSSGYTLVALELAKTHGIDTLRHVDTKSVDWKTYAAIPVHLERTYLKSYQFTFANFETLPLSVTSINPMYLEIMDSAGNRLGFIHDIIAKKWNNEEISHEPGEVEIIVGHGVYVNTSQGKYRTDIRVNLIIAREHYFGPLPIETRGFYNEQTTTITTRQITTDKLEPYLIETRQIEGWQKIKDSNKLAIQPVISTRYSDHMSLIENDPIQPKLNK